MMNVEDTNYFPIEPGHDHSLACLVEGVHAYLQEIDSDRTVCRRHEGTAAVHEQDNELWVARFFETSSATASHLKAALRQRPLCRKEYHQRWGGRRGFRRQHPGAVRNAGRASSLVGCRIAWEDRLLVVRVCPLATLALLQVEVCVPCSEGDLPELPLRALAAALRCHEFLLPELIATPRPVPPGQQEMWLLGIHDYLLRAMPQNLYASQCI